MASDGPRINVERPTPCSWSSRGALNFSLTVRSRDQAYRQGNWGGVLANPATVLSHALASMVDAHGRVLVPGLLPASVPDKLRTALKDVAIGTGADDPALTPGWGRPGLTPAERW